MKIAIFSDNFYPELSGISDSIISLAQELADLGHQIDFYVPQYSAKNFQVYNVVPEELDLGKNIKIHRFWAISYPTPTQQGRLVFPTFLRWLKMRKNKPDIIHTHLFFGVGLEAIAVSKFLKIPLIGTSHTPLTEFLKYSPLKNQWGEKAGLKYVSWYYNHCDFVSAPCKIILDEMKSHGFKKTYKVISNPIDLQNFYPVSAEEKKEIKQKFKLSDFTVLYTGRLAGEKHIDVLIRAIALAQKSIPNLNFAITGHGEAEAALKKLTQELFIEDKVKFFGTLKAEEHAKIYQAADVFAIASTAEMQSLSMMKAMATGIPVIGVNAWALPEYINAQNGFVLEVGDYQGIAEKIIFLYKNPKQRAMLGKGGLKFVQQFSPAKIAKKWESLYQNIASEFYQK